MSVSSNPWGPPVAAPTAPVRLHDVMDEELAAKLQREEEEQWEREIAAQFGDRENVGWCFVEVPSTDSEFGVMSVVQQEVPRDEVPDGDPNDPDYMFALELQAQEAEEYDRLRRQEASSIERIQVMQRDPDVKDATHVPTASSSPHQRAFRPSSGSLSRSRRTLSRYHSVASSGDEFAVHLEEEYEYDSDDDRRGHLLHANGDGHASQQQHQSRHHDHQLDEDDEDLFLEDDLLPVAAFNALHVSTRGPDRKRRSNHHAPASSRASGHSTAASSSSASSSPPNQHHASHHTRS